MKQIAHVDLIVADVERSLEFYVRALGCKVVEDSIVEIPSVAILTGGAADRVRIVLLQLPGTADGGTLLELVTFEGTKKVPVRFGSRETAPLPSLWSVSLIVHDIETVIAELADAGIAMATPIDVVHLPRIGTCRIAFVRDPDGNLVELIDTPEAFQDEPRPSSG